MPPGCGWIRSIPPRSEERRVRKECRSRCSWSSDVCSSDLCIEFQEVHEPVAATSLNGFLDSYAARLRMDTVDTAPVAITDPYGAIRTGAQRNHFLIA